MPGHASQYLCSTDLIHVIVALLQPWQHFFKIPIPCYGQYYFCLTLNFTHSQTKGLARIFLLDSFLARIVVRHLYVLYKYNVLLLLLINNYFKSYCYCCCHQCYQLHLSHCHQYCWHQFYFYSLVKITILHDVMQQSIQFSPLPPKLSGFQNSIFTYPSQLGSWFSFD